jgi:hypothetical protein
MTFDVQSLTITTYLQVPLRNEMRRLLALNVAAMTALHSLNHDADLVKMNPASGPLTTMTSCLLRRKDQRSSVTIILLA